jgi:hypothetical protein
MKPTEKEIDDLIRKAIGLSMKLGCDVGREGTRREVLKAIKKARENYWIYRGGMADRMNVDTYIEKWLIPEILNRIK